MDSIREIFDALSQRIRSPVIGYVILMVLLFNWKVFFFLLFSGEPAETKFTYFDTHTDGWSLFGIPSIVGVAAAVLTPWINVAGQLAVHLPIMRLRTHNAETAHELSLLKAKHKNAENSLIEELIASAKQDEQVKQIEDDEVRERLQQEIDQLREGQDNNISLSGDARDLPGPDIAKQMEVLVNLAENLRERADFEKADEVTEQVLRLSRRITDRDKLRSDS